MSHFYFDYCRACEARTLFKFGFCVPCLKKALESDSAAIILIERMVHDGEVETQREAHPEVGDEAFSDLEPEE